MCQVVVTPDSSVLINLDELSCFPHFEILRKAKSWRILIAEQVLAETGTELGNRMNSILPTSRANPYIQRLSLEHPQLGQGELGAISIGLQMKKENLQCAILLDDKRARKVAHDLGLSFFGTLRLLYLMHKNMQLTLKELLRLFAQLRAAGFWFDEVVVRNVLSAEEEPLS